MAISIATRIQEHLGRSSLIRKMFEEGELLKKKYGADKVYDFSLGNPVVEPPAAFKKELLRLAHDPIPGMHRYMSNAGYVDTRRGVALALAKETGKEITEDHVVMTCGAAAALNVALKTLLNPGEEVIVLAPFFVEYLFYIENQGGISRIVPTGNDFQPDLEALAGAINEKTRAIIINSPNNPTGVVYSEKSLAGLGQLLEKKQKEAGHPIFLLSDEPYAKIAYDGIKVPKVFRYVKNSIVAHSHSKDLALPGERIGYLAVNPDIEDVQGVMDGLIFCNRILGFVNAPALMQHLVKDLQETAVDVLSYQEIRDIFWSKLTELGFDVIKPQGAFYLFPKSPIEDDMAFTEMAKKYNILVVPGRAFGAPGYFRICYCFTMEMVENSFPAWSKLALEAGLRGR